MLQTEAPTSDNDPLVHAVIASAARQHLAALTSRGLAEQAGVSPSVINYRHGSLGGLMETAGSLAQARCARYWTAQTDRLARLSPSATDFAPLAFTAIQGLMDRYRGEERLLWQHRIASARCGGAFGDVHAFEAEYTHWALLLERCGLGRLLPETVLALSSALKFGYLTFPDTQGFSPWALSLILRFADRALRRDVGDGDCALRLAAEAGARPAGPLPAPAHETAGQALDAAIALILEQGVEAATHRAIAARASLSVSSVQHFFGTRRSILLAAYQAIFARTRTRALPQLPGRASLSPRGLLDMLGSRMELTVEENRQDFAALNGLILTASEDADSQAISHGLLARQGATSMHLLSALKDFRSAPSRLDGQLLSMVMSHAQLQPKIDGLRDSSPNAGNLTLNLIETLFV